MTKPLLLLILGVSIAAADPKDEILKKQANEKVKKELKKLNGLWALQKLEIEGTDRPLPDEALYLENGTMLWTNREGTRRNGMTAVFTVDTEKAPNVMEFVITKGFPKDKKLQAIYRIKDDHLEICSNKPDSKELPKQFTTKLAAGRGNRLAVYKRQKGGE